MQQPALFISHGAPTLAIEPCPARNFLSALGSCLRRPDAIVVISAHYAAWGVAVTSDPAPETIHDFGGFPDELYRISYPAPGHPELAHEIVTLMIDAGFPAQAQPDRGLDHGAWIPLSLMFPKADVPVVQVSIDMRETPLWHYRLGQSLAKLRDRNILVIGSGSATHNLREFFHGGYALDSAAQPWVSEFAEWIDDKLAEGDVDAVLQAVEQGPHGARNHPTLDHILPLFVAMGAGAGNPSRRLHQSTTYGVLAMDAYGFGDPAEVAKIKEGVFADAA